MGWAATSIGAGVTTGAVDGLGVEEVRVSVTIGWEVSTVRLQNSRDGEASFAVKTPWSHGVHVLKFWAPNREL